MAQITSEGPEQDSQATSNQNGTGETAETGNERQAVPDPKQEPGDNNENRAGMDVNGGRGAAAAAAAEHGDNPSPVPDSEKETTLTTEKADNDGGEPELCEPGKSPAQGSLASSTDSAQEGSRVLNQEQREGENVSSSPPADRTKTAERAEHGTKRRASVELTSSDGEPLSRMDSEDRSVEVTFVNSMGRPRADPWKSQVRTRCEVSFRTIRTAAFTRLDEECGSGCVEVIVIRCSIFTFSSSTPSSHKRACSNRTSDFIFIWLAPTGFWCVWFQGF